jgi:hypothetical protein
MVEWEYKDYRPAGFECWEVKVDNYYHIAVSKLTDTGTSYTVRLYYKDMTDIKKHIEAADWDIAKVAAIDVVRDYIDRQANYWYSVRERFERVFEEYE